MFVSGLVTSLRFMYIVLHPVLGYWEFDVTKFVEIQFDSTTLLPCN